MLSTLKRREGFTLIELMIVVAIIGILAMIAIPNFIKFQLRSKAGEGKVNLAGIRTAQESFFAEAGSYMPWAVEPVVPPVQQKLPWVGNATACSNPVAPADPGYCHIGWQPEGDVYYQYGVNAANTGGVGVLFNEYFADAISDIDGDGLTNLWGIQVPDINNVSTLGAGPNGCAVVKDVTDSTDATNAIAQVGPCTTVQNGRNIF